MKNISVHLQQFVAESLHPKSLVGRRLSTSEFKKWAEYINSEIRVLSGSAFNHSVKGHKEGDRYQVSILFEIIELSNKINGYLFRYAKVWGKHLSACQIKQSYIATCLAFEALLNDLARRYPEVGKRLPITDHMLMLVKKELKAVLSQVLGMLRNLPIDQELLTVLNDAIGLMISQQPLCRHHESYLRDLLKGILSGKFSSSASLVDHLIINDLNLPDFFLFCVNDWSVKLGEIDGLFEQKEFLLETKSHLFDLSLIRGLKFPSNDQPLYDELNKFLSEKYGIIKERLKLSRQRSLSEGLKPRAKRVLINLSVAQLGLFIRLQIEKGILAKEHIGELFTFFANHFYTPNTDHISPESLQKNHQISSMLPQ